MDGEPVEQILEITLNNLMSDGGLDYRDFLARVDLLAAVGMTVLISNYFEYYRLAGFLARYTENASGSRWEFRLSVNFSMKNITCIWMAEF